MTHHHPKDPHIAFAFARALVLAIASFAFALLPIEAAEHQALDNLRETRDIDLLSFRKLDIFGQEAVGRIHAITQGPDGFMWIGTQQGLFRYDGHRIKEFQNNKDDPKSLADDTVWSLHLDLAGQLWVGTRQGISLYQPETESFKNFLNANDPERPLSNHRVNAIVNCAMNGIYASSEDGDVYQFKEEQQAFEAVNKQNLGLIKSMSIDASGHLWVGAENAIHRLDPQSGVSTTFTSGLSSPDGITNNYITSISHQDDRTLWLGTTSLGVLLFDKERGAQQPESLSETRNEFVNQVTLDTKGRVWIATNGGICVYEPQRDSLTVHSAESVDSPGLPASGINTLWADRQGNLWAGSNFEGIAISVQSKAFQSLHIHKDRPDLPPHAPVFGFLEDKEGNLWVGSESGGLTVYPHIGYAPRAYRPNPNDPSSISGKPILRLFQDSKGQIWIGTYRDGLYRYRPESDDFEHFRNDPDDPYSISGHDIRDIAEDDDGYLWIAMHETGMTRYDPRSGRFRNFDKSEPYEPGVQIRSDWINALLVDRHNRLWIGSPAGVTRIAADRRSAAHYTGEPADPSKLSNPIVYDLYEDSKGRIWVATADGLNRFNPESETFSHYGNNIGLPHKSISTLIESQQGNLWVGTLDGLAKIDPETLSVKTYRTSDGLIGNDFFENCAIKAQDGTLYFGQSRGLSFFKPTEIRDDTTPPEVFITGIRLFNTPISLAEQPDERSYLESSILLTEALEFEHSENALTFEYIAIDYQDPTRNQYAYKLVGQDEDWTYVKSQFEATYTNLRPGQYTFQVKASNHDGFWNENGDSLTIYIQPPLWGTLWFRLSALVVIISIPILFYFIRVSAIKKEARKLEQAVDARTRDLRQANEQLAAANRQILQNGEELERTVRQRTKELEIAKSDAERSDKLKSAFLANMSHEIRTPMNAIVGFLHILDSKDISDEERSQYGSIIRKSTESLMSLIDDILDLSTIEAGQAEINPQPTSVDSICEELGALFRETLSSQKKGEVTFRQTSEIPEELKQTAPPTFYIDPHRLKQILWNLLSNALKFTPQGEVVLGYQIFASSEHPDPYQIRFTVRDTGIGIPKDQHQNIFNRFHKLNPDQTKLYRGTGLGLAITLTLTDLMKGTIEVDSEPGKGTTFYVTFPFIPAQTEAPQIPENVSSAQEATENDLSSRTILVVEDEQPNYDYIMRVLKKTGANTHRAKCGNEALELFAKHRFDLVLLDLKIPGKDGHEVARRIREQNKQIPIVIQSAYAMAGDHLRSQEAGANEHIAKPFRPDQLLETLYRYLGPQA